LAAGKLVGVIVKVLQIGAMVNSRVAEQLFASTARIVKVRETVLVGVPLNTPDALKFKPAGSVPAETLNVTAPVAPLTVSGWL
jgi:hypothetical protein